MTTHTTQDVQVSTTPLPGVLDTTHQVTSNKISKTVSPGEKAAGATYRDVKYLRAVGSWCGGSERVRTRERWEQDGCLLLYIELVNTGIYRQCSGSGSVGLKVFGTSRIRFRHFCADPDPYKSGCFHQQAKKLRKTMISTVWWLLGDFFVTCYHWRCSTYNKKSADSRILILLMMSRIRNSAGQMIG